MTKILFITPYPYQEAPSQRFRFEQYVGWLRENNLELTFAPYFDDKTWKLLYQKGKFTSKMSQVIRAYLKRFVILFQLKKYDYIFIHREMAPIGPPIFEWLLAKVFRRKYIYDFDDAIWLPNYSEANAKFHRMKAYWKVNYAIKWADKITAGNDYLANYARQYNPNVQVIPTTIDTENYHNQLTNHDENQLIIGWTGTHSTMRYLEFIFPIIAELEQEFDFKFRIISDKAPNTHLKSIEFVKWNKETEIADLAQIHIGVMPLKEDQWSEGKCGFKGLQYMALGIASIMSPVGVNKAIIQHGENGFLADTPEAWKETLINLLKNPEKRKEVGLNGRKRVIDAYSVLSQKNNYLTLFKSN